MSRFVRFGGRFELTATGDIDFYPMFAELYLTFTKEAWGVVMPTGIATNESNKVFFSKLIDENRLISLYSFENEERIFQIHHSFKFCLLTAGCASNSSRTISGGFYLRRMDHLLDPNRIYTLKTEDFAKLNPNTKTCPVFRTRRDALLTTKIYNNAEVIFNETTGANPWKVRISNLMHMSHDSDAFKTLSQLKSENATRDKNTFRTEAGITYVPVYEGKMIGLYNHHFASWPADESRPTTIPNTPEIELKNSYSHVEPWYWTPISEVISKLEKRDSNGNLIWKWTHPWLLCYRTITNATTERTFISSIIPMPQGAGNSLIYLMIDDVVLCTIAQGLVSSIVFDYVARQKLGGTNMNNYITKQLPVLSLDRIPHSLIFPIIKRVAYLCYFNHDLDGWAHELCVNLTSEQQAEVPELITQNPYVYDPTKRARVQAEIDAIFAHLYGINTDDLKYILDPEDICGHGSINETFRVLKENEIRQYGEYRTKRLVMDAWYKFGYDK